MLVDHFIEFKGYNRYSPIIGDEIMGIQEFADNWHRLLQQIPQFCDFDFTQLYWLPVSAGLPDDPGNEIDDE